MELWFQRINGMTSREEWRPEHWERIAGRSHSSPAVAHHQVIQLWSSSFLRSNAFTCQPPGMSPLCHHGRMLSKWRAHQLLKKCAIVKVQVECETRQGRKMQGKAGLGLPEQISGSRIPSAKLGILFSQAYQSFRCFFYKNHHLFYQNQTSQTRRSGSVNCCFGTI